MLHSGQDPLSQSPLSAPPEIASDWPWCPSVTKSQLREVCIFIASFACLLCQLDHLLHLHEYKFTGTNDEITPKAIPVISFGQSITHVVVHAHEPAWMDICISNSSGCGMISSDAHNMNALSELPHVTFTGAHNHARLRQQESRPQYF